MNTLIVEGNPIPKERARTVRGHSFTPQRTARQEKLIRMTALAAGIKPASNLLKVEMWFYRANRRRGDVSNMLKLAEDALNGVAWDDDNQIVDLVGHKRIDKDNPRTEIHWEEVGDTWASVAASKQHLLCGTVIRWIGQRIQLAPDPKK